MPFQKGNQLWRKRKFTEEVKQKISFAMKGKRSRLGKKHTNETKQKLSEATKKYAILHGGARKGMKNSVECKKKISLFAKTRIGEKNSFYGKKHTQETINRMQKSRKGKYCRENHPNWKGGISPLRDMIRSLFEYSEWRNTIFKRDNYICQRCCKENSGYLVSHHKIEFNEILSDFLKEYTQFSPLEDKETLMRLAISYDKFWDIDNGITVCKNCHNILHRKKEKCSSSQF